MGTKVPGQWGITTPTIGESRYGQMGNSPQDGESAVVTAVLNLDTAVVFLTPVLVHLLEGLGCYPAWVLDDRRAGSVGTGRAGVEIHRAIVELT